MALDLNSDGVVYFDRNKITWPISAKPTPVLAPSRIFRGGFLIEW
jgi:hypothetical protein